MSKDPSSVELQVRDLEARVEKLEAALNQIALKAPYGEEVSLIALAALEEKDEQAR